MEVFSWRSGPVGCGRTEDRPLQRSKTSSGGMSQSCPDYPGQSPLPVNFRLSRSKSSAGQLQIIQGSNCLSIGPKDNNKRMTIEHDLRARSRARFVLWPYLPVTLSLTLLRYLTAIRLSGSRWRQPGQTGSVALFERGEHQVRLVRLNRRKAELDSLRHNSTPTRLRSN